jgi:hypothetical protein
MSKDDYRRNIELVLEENPKWHLLAEILDEVEHELAEKQSKSMISAFFKLNFNDTWFS